MRRASLVLIAAVAALGAPDWAAAQERALSLRATRRDPVEARATVTATFAVTNLRRDTVQVLPRVELPANWVALTGTTSFALPPGSAEVVLLSVAVPARAPAGEYVMRYRTMTPDDLDGVADSVTVVVPVRDALDVGLLDRPAFIVSGREYSARFLVRNRGNGPASIRLSARSSLGAAAVRDSVIRLDADESREIRVQVATPAGLESAGDDVLELAAAPADTTRPRDPVEASARVLVVPEPNRKIEEYLKVPTQLHLRAASSNGVAPFAVYGRGDVRDGGAEQVEFLLRGPTGRYSPFGERDEYRAHLITPSWSVKLGDHNYAASTLTGAAQPGFGAGVDGSRGRVSAGAYGQQFRRDLLGGGEGGGFLAVRPIDDARVALNYVARNGGFLTGRVGSVSGSLARRLYTAELEVARSSADDGNGSARNARVSGNTGLFVYDVGHIFADTAFTGPQRGAEHNYLTASSLYWDRLTLTLNASSHSTDLSRSAGVPYVDRLDLGTLGATLLDRYTVELGTVARGVSTPGASQQNRQFMLRGRADHETRFAGLTFEGEVGRAAGDQPPVVYTDIQVGARRSVGGGSVSGWVERYSGGSITHGSASTITVGGDAVARVNRLTDVALRAYATRVRSNVTEWHSHVDAQVTRLLPNGNTVSLRARLASGGSFAGVEENVAYLEYGIPLRLPVSRLRTPGRVFGQVVDASTGRGVSGALVRLGPQVAITDDRGQVAFGGVPGGEHRLSMSQEASFSNAVFVGDPTLTVDSARTSPTSFRLEIARSARVSISVRRFTAARTAIAEAPDSLVDAGPQANATLMLTAGRDTLYRTTDENGQAAFTDLPPGRWTITVRGDAPAFHRFDPDRLELVLLPGEAREIRFRLVPRKRDVQMMGGEQELTPLTAEPKQEPAGGRRTRTVKPSDLPTGR